MLWFTSDEHYDHYRILKYCDRPFSSLEEMQEFFIKRHNSVVKPGDEVWHLGDTFFKRKTAYILQRLNGDHYLVLGNHDCKQLKRGDLLGFQSIQTTKTIEWAGERFFLSHYAHRVWDRSHYGTFHLYGHSHGTLPGFGRSMDVGVDPMCGYPISAEEVIERLEHIPFKNVDVHYNAWKDIVDGN